MIGLMKGSKEVLKPGYIYSYVYFVNYEEFFLYINI